MGNKVHALMELKGLVLVKREVPRKLKCDTFPLKLVTIN